MLRTFARCGLYKEASTNDNPVTWIFQILVGAPDASTPSLPEVILFSLKLCYDFQFAGHKAAQVGIHPLQFAVMSLPHQGASTYSSSTDWEESLHRQSLCVSQLHAYIWRLGHPNSGADFQFSICHLQLQDLHLSPGSIMPSFLQCIDEYLQGFTRGITAEAPYLPSVANHKFRKLLEFQMGEGDATGTFSISQHVPTGSH